MARRYTRRRPIGNSVNWFHSGDYFLKRSTPLRSESEITLTFKLNRLILFKRRQKAPDKHPEAQEISTRVFAMFETGNTR